MDPLSPSNHFNLGAALLNRGDLDEAEASYRRAAEVNPTGGLTHTGPALVYLLQGRYEAAERMIADEVVPLGKLSVTAMVQHSLGRRDRSEAALQELVQGHDRYGSYMIATVHAWRGELDPAFAWLDRAYALREPSIASILVDPFLASLRGDPRWRDLVRRIGLPAP